MERANCSRRVAGKAKLRAKGIPVRKAEDVRVFDERNRLTLPRIAGVEEWVQVVNRGQVCRHQRKAVAAQGIWKREFMPGLVHLVHGVRREIV